MVSIHTVLLYTLYTIIKSLTCIFFHITYQSKLFWCEYHDFINENCLSYAYFMTHFVYSVKWHIGNVFNKPPRQNAPTDRVLTRVILKGIEWAFRKVYPTKIPGMVHQGLLAPQSLGYVAVYGQGAPCRGFL